MKIVTSPIKENIVQSHAQQPTNDGKKFVTSDAVFRKETEQIKDALAMLKDVTNLYPCKMQGGKMPEPLISTDYGCLVILFPLGGHVIRNVVTSDGKADFEVDGERIIPVTSKE